MTGLTHRGYISERLQLVLVHKQLLTSFLFFLAVAVYALCGFGNVSSLGIQIGVLTSLAPSQKAVIARGA
jgi:nucleoside permease NupC